MKVKFNREYLPILASFMAINDMRYYLNGFHVKPHPEAGVILTATDGHRLVTIHDKGGISDGEYILPISNALLKASKKTNLHRILLNSIQFIDNKVYVLNHDNDNGKPFFKDNNKKSNADLVSHIEYTKEIEGRFPNTKEIFKQFEFAPVDNIGVNVEYAGKLKSICTTSKHPQLNLMFSGANGLVAAVSGHQKEIVAVIMPTRVDDEKLSIPDFVNFGGGSPREPK